MLTVFFFSTSCFHVEEKDFLVSAASSQLSTSQTTPIQLPLIGTLGNHSKQVVDWTACWFCKMNWPLSHPKEVSYKSGWQHRVEWLTQLFPLSCVLSGLHHKAQFPSVTSLWKVDSPFLSLGFSAVSGHDPGCNWLAAVAYFVEQQNIWYGYLTDT